MTPTAREVQDEQGAHINAIYRGTPNKEASMTRLSVNINDDTATALKDLAAAKGVTVTEIVRRAVSVYEFVAAETAEGHIFELVDAHANTVQRLKVLG